MRKEILCAEEARHRRSNLQKGFGHRAMGSDYCVQIIRPASYKIY
jgi:hypothetical protein